MSETFDRKVSPIPGRVNGRRTGNGKIPHRKPVVSEKQVSYNIDMLRFLLCLKMSMSA